MRGILAGALALVALHTLVSSGSTRIAPLFRVPGRVAVRFLDPTVPAIPDRRPDDEAGLRAGLGETTGAGRRRYPDPFQIGGPRG